MADVGRERKKDRRDRKDGYYVKRTEDIAEFLAYLGPTKIANSSLITLRVEMTPILEFVEKEKAEGRNVSMFTVLVTSAVRLCAMRENINCFVKNRKLYRRKVISIGYIIASSRDDTSKRGMTSSAFDPSSNVYDVSSIIIDGADRVRSGEKWGTEVWLSRLARCPWPLKRFLAWTLMGLDRRGWVPRALTATDPCSSTIFISNLGSIGGVAVYHHMIEWGTNSIFVTLGKINEETRIEKDGKLTTVPMMDILITVDDRISDGVYMANSMDLWSKIIAEPEKLRERYNPEGGADSD